VVRSSPRLTIEVQSKVFGLSGLLCSSVAEMVCGVRETVGDWKSPLHRGCAPWVARNELDRMATMLKNGDYTAGSPVPFDYLGKKRISDIDGFNGGVAESIKRQAKTVDNWSRRHGKPWLEAWMISIKNGQKAADGTEAVAGRNIIRFVYGGADEISAAAKKRLQDIVDESDALKGGKMTLEFVQDTLKPPPFF